ncbi:SGNH/GDSL hydrolase family protein [Bacteroides muris (ex Fokt et al. 2023)]|uniref:SGNH/GDSL hydrolase family protein n=1 Tax=Bacteroides muris (ex Fokt et al. 2023) TaxID=2937417 RepID=A0A9X2SSA3_9BACE|nr:SGNH/GDSL hydrolase family protein [Bacteroides muris (ex Fokt et al. 2023)]MCR6503688.1 SGNH/GDSL hydrolase family protein [Bacteroides muris (ex Fokt et al. 2023)]
MKKRYALLLLLLIGSLHTQAQIKWSNPLNQPFPVIRGRAWHNEQQRTYARLPLKAKNLVNKAVWNLSQQSAGLSIAFYSNSPEIKIKYTVTGGRSMAHMPATGVSGVDLYATDRNGRSRWCAAKYSLGDTLVYTYDGLTYEDASNKGYEYTLFLPLYNSVSFLEIGVKDNASISFIPVSEEKPLVVYGTSIAQGACASRPGMAWINIINRTMEHPVVNLGFSGSGKLEKELFELLAETDAKLYIIDCMPNMISPADTAVIAERILTGIKTLRTRNQAPVLLVEHSGYMNEYTSDRAEASYKASNRQLRKAYNTLMQQEPDIYYLTKEEIGLSMDAMVKGAHPSDLSMQQYADSYVKKIREILKEETGTESTCIPCKQQRDPYDWQARHEQILKLNRTDSPEAVIIGNSIVYYWAGEPLAHQQRGKHAWSRLFKGTKVHNLGFGWDKIENVLWRIYHGELDGYEAKNIFMLIGTNNLQFNTDHEIIEGIVFTAKAIRERQPSAKLHVIGILPRKGQEQRIAHINTELQQELVKSNAIYIDLTPFLTKRDGRIDESLFGDGLHPNEKGYKKIAEALLKERML